jgi:hypothetical protein
MKKEKKERKKRRRKENRNVRMHLSYKARGLWEVLYVYKYITAYCI